MTARKAIRALLAVFAAFLLAAGAAAPAMAQESPGVVFENQDEMSAQARYFNEVEITHALYQCPAYFCNRGEVRPGQALGEVCTLVSSDGIKWALVYNRANEHTGFIETRFLIHEDPNVDCGRDGLISPSPIDMNLYQCPAFHCNVGKAKRGDILRGECYVHAGDWYWIWVYNRNNHHEGFYVDTSDSDLEPCRV
ncbi:hypothetical protein [Lentzea sp. NPDC051838]|uniref:hypothetical protein n=1 Tax=Lentzea sp. NPDC051838 TaxID=3154849 RepID=UPI003422DC98